MKKIISLFICIAMLISMSVISASAETYAKNWEFESGVEGFGGNNSTLTSVNGNLVQTITSDKVNTWLVSQNNLNVDASVYKYLKVRVKNSTTDEGYFRFQAIGTNKEKFSDSWTSLGSTPNDGEWHEYVVDLSQYGTEWSGTISRLRLCMSAWTTEGTVEYDYIRLSDTGDLSACTVSLDSLTNPSDKALGETIALTATAAGDALTKIEYFVNGTSVGSATNAPYTVDWKPSAVGGYHVKAVASFAAGDLESDTAYVAVYNPEVVENNAYIWDFNGTTDGWQGNNSKVESKENCLVQTVEASKNNSFLVSSSGLSIDASKYKYIKVRVAADYNLKGQFAVQWIKQGEDLKDYDAGWKNSDKTQIVGNTTITNDGEFHDYVIDLSEHTGWTGNISQLRIKITPWNDTEIMNAKVDFIRISDTLANGIDSSLVPVEIPEINVEEVGRFTAEGSNPAVAYTGTFELNNVAVSGVRWTVGNKSKDLELGEALSGSGDVVVGLVVELTETSIMDYTAVPTAECIAAE